jgi:hypothetical protein
MWRIDRKENLIVYTATRPNGLIDYQLFPKERKSYDPVESPDNRVRAWFDLSSIDVPCALGQGPPSRTGQRK